MILSYIKRHYKIVILILCFIIIFMGVFSLYNYALEAILYSGALCLFVGIIAFCFGFWQYREKHKKLLEILATLDMGLDSFPEPQGRIEEDYQAIARELWAQEIKTSSALSSASRDMQDYYTLWAHQIKTPIAAMRLLLEGDEGKNTKLLSAELFKTEQYVDMVLQYVRLGSESSDLELKKVDLDAIIKACLRKYARLFSLKQLEFSFTETNLTVLTDEKWLSFVIEQVFSNSLKYTPEGRISIFAEGESLVIEDTGIGIRAEDLPRVCEKGYTGAIGRQDKSSTGIGLFLCKSILSKLGHSFEITSRVGVGTAVKIGFDHKDIVFE